MLSIKWDGDYYEWSNSEFTDYDFIGDWFVVLKDKQWVGFYRADDLEMVEMKEDEEND